MALSGLEAGPQFWRELLAEVAPPGSPIDPSRMLRQPTGTPGMQSGAPNWGQMMMDPDGLRKWLMQMMFAGRMGL